MTQALAAIQAIHARRPYSQALIDSGLLHPEVEWLAAGSPSTLPWAGRHVGAAGVRQFFAQLGGSMVYEGFEAQQYIAQGDSVVAVIKAWGHARETGRPFRSDIVRIYTFSSGKIVQVHNFYDTAAYEQALRAL